MTELEFLRRASHRASARELAHMVIEFYYGTNPPRFPINVFGILKDFKVNYTFQDLEGLEGMYIPDKDGYVAVVSINKNRKYERQRFTAAHELCHHLKDYEVQSVSPIDDTNDPLEIYANTFAAELLMPRKYFLEKVRAYEDEQGIVLPHKALYLCNIFGVSFQSVMWQLDYHQKLDFVLTKDFFKTFKVNQRLMEMSIGSIDDIYLADILDSYSYIPISDNKPMWYRLINTLIYNDAKIEGLDIEKAKVAEICTDIRLFGAESSYFSEHSDNKSVIETVGQYLAYSRLMELDEEPDRYHLKEFHKILFSHAPNHQFAGEYRTSDNSVRGSRLRTSRYDQIQGHMFNLDQDMKYHIDLFTKETLSYVVKISALYHHRLTEIHPYSDGNGRISRILLNWILKLGNLAPVYVEALTREDYLNALEEADNGNFDKLNKYFLNRVLENMVLLNSGLTMERSSISKLS